MAVNPRLALERVAAALAPHLPADFSDTVERGDLMGIYHALHSLPADSKRAAAASLPPMEASLLLAVSRIPPAQVEAVVEAVPRMIQQGTGAAVSGQEEVLGAAHRLLQDLPVDAREALQTQLPTQVQPLVGLAADLEPAEFAEVRVVSGSGPIVQP